MVPFDFDRSVISELSGLSLDLPGDAPAGHYASQQQEVEQQIQQELQSYNNPTLISAYPEMRPAPQQVQVQVQVQEKQK